MFVTPYLANITIFAGNFAPRGWMFCNGQLLQISLYDALYSLIGTIYGGDGVQTFALPDLRGRVAIHAGQGIGLANYILGQQGGTESVTLTIGQLPVHTHTFSPLTVGMPAFSGAGTLDNPPGNVPAQTQGVNNYNTAGTSSMASSTVNTNTVLSPGGNQPVGIVSPVTAMNYIIAVEGVYPSRN